MADAGAGEQAVTSLDVAVPLETKRTLSLAPSKSQLEKEKEQEQAQEQAAGEAQGDDPFARVVEKKLRKTVKEAFAGHVVKGVFKSWYLGARPAKLINDDDPDRTASDVMQDAITHLVRRKSKVAKPMKIYVVSTDTTVALVSRETGRVFGHISAPLLEELYFEEARKPLAFAFSHHSSRLGVDYISVFECKPKYAGLIEPSLEEAVRTEKPHRRSSLRRAGSLGKAARVVGAHAAHWLGTVPVEDNKGTSVVETALAAVRRKMKKSRDRALFVTLVCSQESVTYVEALTDDILHETHISNISFVTLCEEGRSEEIFAYIEADDRLDHILCHLFSCEQGVAEKLCQLCGEAMNKAREERERKAGDPFYPEGDMNTVEGPLARIQLSRDQITAVKVLGAGQFGTVYLANLSNDFAGFDDDNEEDRQVAVKLLRSESSDSDVAEFRYECEVMCDLVHPNVVRLLGVCFEQRPWLAVLEMMNYGDLRTVMRTCVQKRVGVTLLEKLVLIEQALAGMVYIAERGYVHMDVAARNMLLHTNNLVKIADFGIAHKVDPETKKFRLRGFLRLAVRWMAPETLGGSPIYFSERTDVYAFCVFMWEIFQNGLLPFHTMKSRAARDAIRDGAILAKPDACPQELYDLMTTAWERDVEARWTFQQLHDKVRNYLLAEEQRSDKPARDIGAALNDSLTQTFRRLSVKASMVRRQSQKMGKDAKGMPAAGARKKKPSFSTGLATMREENAEVPEEEEENQEEDADDAKVGVRPKPKGSKGGSAEPKPMKEHSAVIIDDAVDESKLVRRKSENLDLDLFETGKEFPQMGRTDDLG